MPFTLVLRKEKKGGKRKKAKKRKNKTGELLTNNKQPILWAFRHQHVYREISIIERWNSSRYFWKKKVL